MVTIFLVILEILLYKQTNGTTQTNRIERDPS